MAWHIASSNYSFDSMLSLLAFLKSCPGTHLTSQAYRTETGQIERLSSLVAWLVGQLEGLKLLRCKETAAERKASSIGMNLSNTILMEVLRKCLLVSLNGNKQLMDSALHLAQLMGDTSVMGKLKKPKFVSFVKPRCYPREVFSPVFE